MGKYIKIVKEHLNKRNIIIAVGVLAVIFIVASTGGGYRPKHKICEYDKNNIGLLGPHYPFIGENREMIDKDALKKFEKARGMIVREAYHVDSDYKRGLISSKEKDEKLLKEAQPYMEEMAKQCDVMYSKLLESDTFKKRQKDKDEKEALGESVVEVIELINKIKTNVTTLYASQRGYSGLNTQQAKTLNIIDSDKNPFGGSLEVIEGKNESYKTTFFIKMSGASQQLCQELMNRQVHQVGSTSWYVNDKEYGDCKCDKSGCNLQWEFN